MSLVAGTRLGPYEIQSAIGAGGMGEVYKARDTRLDRIVAIKILPAELSADPERRARFEREARAVAALNHPHICTLHDIGSHDGTTFLVMEYLAGESLAERLLHGPVPLAQALDIGTQIADALDAAHKHGIIHRDLKPGNVVLTTSGAGRSGVTVAKLLDFGLAKLAAHGERPAVAGDASLPTQAAPVTAKGTILGTLQYMAPEQLEGKEADARTDLWALGAILYEMLTGNRAFTGASQASLITAIMSAEPRPMTALKPLTPASLDHVVATCLEKDPEARWQAAGDVARELRWIVEQLHTGSAPGPGGTAAVSSRRARRLGMAITGAALATAVGLGGLALGWKLRPTSPPASPVRLNMDVHPADQLRAGGIAADSSIPTPGGSRTALAWTPDGRSIVFVGRRAGVQQLYIRPLDAAEARPLPNTEGAQVPTISPDGRWVAFWARGTIRKTRVAGGPATELAQSIRTVPWGMAWDDHERLYFGRQSIWMVPPGGKPEEALERGAGERVHAFPSFLPGSRVLLYTVRRAWYCWGDDEVFAYTIATRQRKRLLTNAVDARYVPTGHLVFMRVGVLYAVPFDPERLEPRGPEVAISEDIAQALISGNADDASGAGQFAVSSTGTLAWLAATSGGYRYRRSQVIAVDRRGQVSPVNIPVQSYGQALKLSPDGNRLALSIRSLANDRLWVYDLERGSQIPLTDDGEANYPLWTPDGRYVMFGWTRGGIAALWMRASDGSGEPVQLTQPGFTPASFSPTGEFAATFLADDGTRDIVVGRVIDGKARLTPTVASDKEEAQPQFSPDGRWLAYMANLSGRNEVYVRSYPGPGAAVPASVGGGVHPSWNPNGREILYAGPTDPPGGSRMLAVEFTPGSPPRIGKPKELFVRDPGTVWGCPAVRCFDLTADGTHFYAWKPEPLVPVPAITQIQILQNWFEELKAKVPTTK